MASAAYATEECDFCSDGEPPTAPGFQYTRQAYERHMENIHSQWAKHEVPPLSKTVKWRVYELPSYYMEHYSLYFECASSPYRQSPGFCIWLKIAKREAVIPILNVYQVPPTYREDLLYLGAITSSVENIVHINLECLKKFGDYNFSSNNCIHYCTKLAKKLGLREGRRDEDEKKTEEGWSTGEKAVAWGVAGAIGMGILGGLAALMSAGGDDEKQQEQRRR